MSQVFFCVLPIQITKTDENGKKKKIHMHTQSCVYINGLWIQLHIFAVLFFAPTGSLYFFLSTMLLYSFAYFFLHVTRYLLFCFLFWVFFLLLQCPAIWKRFYLNDEIKGQYLFLHFPRKSSVSVYMEDIWSIWVRVCICLLQILYTWKIKLF